MGVLGGGPSGSLFAYFLLIFADRMDLDVSVDIYEPRDFTRPGPGGCNMCGGIVSESLIQLLATEGINLPSNIVQRGIDSYVLHSDEDTVRIDTPLQEKRIATVYRGGGPRDIDEVRWGGLDGYLLDLAREHGAKVMASRVNKVDWDDGKPRVVLEKGSQTYDLLVGAVGINSAGWKLFEDLGFESKRPETTKAYITELKLGAETIDRHFGNSMHMFLLNIPRLDCAAIIPKGEYVTVCLLGRDIDRELVSSFFESEPVKRLFPSAWSAGQGACHCSPRINVREASMPFIDRVVLVGDSGVTRLYKDGIGAAYRTAKAAALTSVFGGVAASDFQRHYWPVYRAISRDNHFGLVIFAVVHQVKALKTLVRGVMRMAAREQESAGPARRMSIVLWDMFTGSAPYRDVSYRTLDPRFGVRFILESALSIGRGNREN